MRPSPLSAVLPVLWTPSRKVSEGNMQLDILQVVINLLVAGASAWFGGKLGVRYALEKTREERGFDRQLQWYEETVRVIQQFRRISEEYTLALRREPSKLSKVAKEIEPIAIEFHRLFNEALVYAPRATIYQLGRTITEL